MDPLHKRHTGKKHGRKCLPLPVRSEQLNERNVDKKVNVDLKAGSQSEHGMRFISPALGAIIS